MLKWGPTKSKKMATTSVFLLILVVLFCISAAGARREPYLIDAEDGISISAPVSNDSICKTMVETQGYACEEHTVILIPLSAR